MKNSYYFIKLNDLVLAYCVTFSSPTTRPSGVPVCDTSITKSAASDIYFALYNPLALIDPNIIKLNVGTKKRGNPTLGGQRKDCVPSTFRRKPNRPLNYHVQAYINRHWQTV